MVLSQEDPEILRSRLRCHTCHHIVWYMLLEEVGKGDVDFFSLYGKAILIASA